MSLTQLGRDLLWHESNVTAGTVEGEIEDIMRLPLPDEVKRDICDRLQAVAVALNAAYAAMAKVAKDVHELAWYVDNGNAAGFKLSKEEK